MSNETATLVKLSAAEQAAIKKGDVTSRELVEAHLKVIEAAEPSIKAFLKVSGDVALEQADAFDAKSAEDKAALPELAGVPIAIKDMIVTKGIETTAASKILEGWVPPYDATVIEKLKAAGMPLLGKTNLDEFAQGSSTEHSAYQTTHNPWDTERVPGGSGGGSAAAVAAFEAPLALGTDTGGSIRQPGSLTGTVGVKPTYGGVSRFGAIAMASSLDQIGPCSRTVLDAALLQEVIGGHDKRDSTSIPEGPRPMVAAAREGMKRDLKGLKVGLIKELGGEGFQPGVMARFNEGVKKLEEMGAEVTEVSLPHLPYSLGAYYIIMPSEVSSNLARYDGMRYGLRVMPPTGVPQTAANMMAYTREAGFGDEVKRRIILGTYALSAGYYDAWYGSAQKVHADYRRLQEGLRTGRRARGPHQPVHRLQVRREDGRPAGHVHERHRHHSGQPRRRACHVHPGRPVRRRPARRLPVHRPAAARRSHVQAGCGPRSRAGRQLERPDLERPQDPVA